MPFSGKYLYAVGKRKTAMARVRLYAGGKGKITVNQKDWKEYFPTFILQKYIVSPLGLTSQRANLDLSIMVKGGGKKAQAEAVRHGISRALLKLDVENFRPILKRAGFLTRDSRKKERKKPGLKRARRAPQWQKR